MDFPFCWTFHSGFPTVIIIVQGKSVFQKLQRNYLGIFCLNYSKIFMFCLSLFKRLAKHVMQVHLNAAQTNQGIEGELELNLLKKYIDYCRK